MPGKNEQTEILQQFDHDAARLLTVLQAALGTAHWLVTMQANSIRHIRKLLVHELTQ